MTEESVPHALERWRQAERDALAARDDPASSAVERQEAEEEVVEAHDDYERAADRELARQKATKPRSVAKLGRPWRQPRP